MTIFPYQEYSCLVRLRRRPQELRAACIAVIGAEAVMTAAVPDHAIVGGTPARVLKSRLDTAGGQVEQRS